MNSETLEVTELRQFFHMASRLGVKGLRLPHSARYTLMLIANDMALQAVGGENVPDVHQFMGIDITYEEDPKEYHDRVQDWMDNRSNPL